MDLRIKPSHAYVLATLLGAHFVHVSVKIVNSKTNTCMQLFFAPGLTRFP